LSSASLELEINLENPNNLNVLLNQILFELRINEKKWISGDQTQPQKISAHASQMLKIPFSLNFLEIGQTVFLTMKETKNLNYNFSGKILVEGSDLSISSTYIPFVTTGNLPLKR
jgi:LEA14-like dessication related protein